MTRVWGAVVAVALTACRQSPPPPAVGCAAPPASEALGAWLEADCYGDWPADAVVRRSAMNPGGVRVFRTPDLEASLRADSAAHPVGVAAVREMYAADLVTRTGRSAMVKTAQGWFWYERFDRQSAPSVASIVAPGCTGCHSAARDAVL